jgi:hypothetical protein
MTHSARSAGAYPRRRDASFSHHDRRRPLPRRTCGRAHGREWRTPGTGGRGARHVDDTHHRASVFSAASDSAALRSFRTGHRARLPRYLCVRGDDRPEQCARRATHSCSPLAVTRGRKSTWAAGAMCPDHDEVSAALCGSLRYAVAQPTADVVDQRWWSSNPSDRAIVVPSMRIWNPLSRRATSAGRRRPYPWRRSP